MPANSASSVGGTRSGQMAEHRGSGEAKNEHKGKGTENHFERDSDLDASQKNIGNLMSNERHAPVQRNLGQEGGQGKHEPEISPNNNQGFTSQPQAEPKESSRPSSDTQGVDTSSKVKEQDLLRKRIIKKGVAAKNSGAQGEKPQKSNKASENSQALNINAATEQEQIPNYIKGTIQEKFMRLCGATQADIDQTNEAHHKNGSSIPPTLMEQLKVGNTLSQMRKGKAPVTPKMSNKTKSPEPPIVEVKKKEPEQIPILVKFVRAFATFFGAGQSQPTTENVKRNSKKDREGAGGPGQGSGSNPASGTKAPEKIDTKAPENMGANSFGGAK